MEDLTVDLVIALHDRRMTVGGGDRRILSEANLHQMVLGANLIKACVPRAAFVFYFLCAYPAFREDNSGTAIAVTEQVLSSGGYRIQGGCTEMLTLAEGIRVFTTEPEDVEHWLDIHTLESVPS
jgi:hypothetical protein